MKEEMKMKKTAIVTGGSRGIGYGIARQLGLDGYNIAILDINKPENYQGNLDELDQLGISYYYMEGSITSASDRALFLAGTLERFGSIDVLINNAGVAPKVRLDLLEMTEESFDYVVGTNTKGTDRKSVV